MLEAKRNSLLSRIRTMLNRGKYQCQMDDEDETTTTCNFLPQLSLQRNPPGEIPDHSVNITTLATGTPEILRKSPLSATKQIPENMVNTNMISEKSDHPSHLHEAIIRKKEQAVQTEYNFYKLQTELEVYKDKVKMLEAEKNSLLSRLSELMGKTLVDGNPYITNLNDTERPQKIGEMYVSIYDNDWTDVYSSLQDSKFESEQIIDILLGILKITNEKCKVKIDEFVRYIENWFSSFSVTVDVEFSKCVSSLSDPMIKHLQENIRKDVISKYGENIMDQCGTYTNQCIKMCFLTLTKTPPMYLQFDCKVIDRKCFKVFKKDGDEVDYLVWPALFLHEDGPIIEKGVVQCK